MVAALAAASTMPAQDNRKCDAIHQVTGFQIYTIGMTLKVKLVIQTVRNLSWVRHNSCAPGFGSQTSRNGFVLVRVVKSAHNFHSHVN